MAVTSERMSAERAPVRKTGESASVAELVGAILDKGIVIDAWARVPVLGLEILTVEARVAVASIDTYLRYAETIGLTALAAPRRAQQVTRGREKQQDAGRQLPPGDEQQAGRQLPSEDEALRYLAAHPEGLEPGGMRGHFDAPRE